MSSVRQLDPTPVSTGPSRPAGLRSLLRPPVLLALAVTIPALVARIGGLEAAPLLQLVVFGAAVVGASFLLAWAAEAAQMDISGGLAIAVLAVIVVLPEYAVDLFYAWTAGHDPSYTQFAAANMTGSNRLLLGLGWPLVVLVALAASRRAGRGRAAGVDTGAGTGTRTADRGSRTLRLDSGIRLELGFLLIAGILAFVIPVTGQIHLALGLVLLAWFVFYLYRLAQGEAEEPDLVGTAATLGALPRRTRRITVVALFLFAAAVILACAEPFATSLVNAGSSLGVDRFLLVQWLAPLASEAPEFIVAVIFASHGKGAEAIATLISSKVNQWTMLVGSLPVAYLIGGGSGVLVLDGRQVEEMLLTATQTMMGVALILGLRFHRNAALALLALFLVQFFLPGQTARLVLSGVYGTVALVFFVINRRHLAATLRAPFQRGEREAPAPQEA